MADASFSTPKRVEDDCDMVTTLQAPALSKTEMIIQECARKDDSTRLQKLLEKFPVFINCKNNLDRTPLHMSASQGHVEATKVLLQFKANMEAADKYGMTPLLWAAYFGHTDVVDILLLKGANIKRRNKQGSTIVHLAAEKGHTNLLKAMWKRAKSLNANEIDRKGQTPLQVAVTMGHTEFVDYMVSEKHVKCDTVCLDKKSALHSAAINGHLESLKIILTNAPLIINFKDSDDKSALHYACELGHVGIAKELLSWHVEADAEATRNLTAMHMAAISGNSEIIRLLIGHGCNVNACDTNGNTSLHLAATNGHAECVRVLIKSGGEIDMPNIRLQTPIHAAVEQNKPDTAEILLLNGANLTVVDKMGKTPLHLATRASYISLVDMIIKAERYNLKKKQMMEKQNTQSMAGGTRYTSSDHLEDGIYRPADFMNVFNIHTEETETDLSPENYRLKEFNQVYADEFKVYLWKIAFKHIRETEWKRLAYHWNFTPLHISAIEHQHTGTHSYKHHCYRILCIWFHGISPSETPLRELYEGLVAIGRKELAAKIRRKLDKTHLNLAKESKKLLG